MCFALASFDCELLNVKSTSIEWVDTIILVLFIDNWFLLGLYQVEHHLISNLDARLVVSESRRVKEKKTRQQN